LKLVRTGAGPGGVAAGRRPRPATEGIETRCIRRNGPQYTLRVADPAPLQRGLKLAHDAHQHARPDEVADPAPLQRGLKRRHGAVAYWETDSRRRPRPATEGIETWKHPRSADEETTPRRRPRPATEGIETCPRLPRGTGPARRSQTPPRYRGD